MRTRSTIIITGAVLLCGVLLISGFIAYQKGIQQKSPSVSADSYATLLSGNAPFARGEYLRLHDDPKAAVSAFNEALPLAKNVSEEAKIKLRLALSEGISGDYQRAITLYKEIGANVAYPAIVRSYAVEDLTVLNMSNGGMERIVTSTFNDEPYKSMYVPSDMLLTYRHMAEYASSIYPSADSELLIAIWYADDLIAAKNGNVDSSRVVRDFDIIKNKVANANRDILRIQKLHENYLATIPYILLQKAKISGKLDLAGEKPIENPDQAFQKAIDAYNTDTVPGMDGYARYYYASYLTKKHGVSAKGKISSILAPLYTGAVYETKPIQSYLKNVRSSVSSIRKGIATMASIDPAFKEHLQKLGWQEADFKY